MESLLPLLQTAMDSIDVGIYILDEKGYYIYVNNAFVKITGFSKQHFTSGVNVLERKHNYDVCVSELVYQTKKKVVMFQDVNIRIPQLSTPRAYRQIISSTPIFDGNGNVKNIIAMVLPFYLINEMYQAARSYDIVSYRFSTDQPKTYQVVAKSKEMREAIRLVERIANTDSSVLILGESGVGKEVVAHHLHRCSSRKEKPLVEIDCTSLPENLLESELFGYEKGAFTGALSTGKKGLIEEADGGTLFLDEINSLPLSLQSKLLRVLETRKIRRIGSNVDKPVDFRLVSATNQSLKKLCAEGKFRDDLFYRLNVVPVFVPALRERIDDIIPLTNLFLTELGNKYGKIKNLAKPALDQLLNYDWPGNVRELRNFIERVIVTSEDDVIEINRIPDSMFGIEDDRKKTEKIKNYIFIDNHQVFSSYEDTDFSLTEYLDACEKSVLESVLRAYGSTHKAAEVLKISQASVVRKKNKYGIDYST